MASNEDTDDLYADLYGDDGSGDVVDLGGNGDDKANASDEQDLIGYDEDDKTAGATGINDNGTTDDKTEAKSAAAPSTGSFIPPPSSAPAQSGAGLQIKGSFIPPPAANSSSAHSQSDIRDLTPASHNAASNDGQASHAAQGGYEGHNGQDAGADGQGHGDRPIQPHEMPEEGKMFVGGLNWDTTEDSLRRYFSQFGEVGHCTVMRDNMTGRSRGFAFLNFVDPKAVNTVMVREHYLDGKVIDPKRAIPRPQQQQHTYNNRGYNNNNNFGASNSSDDDSSLQHVLSIRPLVFDGKEVDVKRAQSKNDPQSLQIRRQQRFENPEMMQQGAGTGANRFGMGNGGGNNFNSNAWAGMNPMMMGMMGAGTGADMTQMYQSMGWGNPQMAWQQMMASMAGQTGASGGMDMGAMMNSMGMGGMGMMGAMGNGSPPSGNAISPTPANAQKAPTSTGEERGGSGGPVPTGPAASRYQRGGGHMAGGGRIPTGPAADYNRERSPRGGGGGSYQRERSPNRRDDRRYDGGNRNRY
uniref:RRM domain-containing protein n=1 Tax=Kalmanozyma brasiliensis (strain GHG001) TaxID=1365824 RepID=V5ESK7_KALBG